MQPCIGSASAVPRQPLIPLNLNDILDKWGGSKPPSRTVGFAQILTAIPALKGLQLQFQRSLPVWCVLTGRKAGSTRGFPTELVSGRAWKLNSHQDLHGDGFPGAFGGIEFPFTEGRQCEFVHFLQHALIDL